MMSEQARQSRDDGPRFGLDIPVLVLALAFFVSTAFQTFELVKQSSDLVKQTNDLAAARANQDQPLAELAKVQGMVQAMGLDTVKLAEAGNVTAREVIDAMAKQGVKFGPPPAPAAAPKN